LIEDDRNIAAALRQALLRDYSVSVVTSGSNGLRAARTVNPDLIILDLQLPDMNGLAVCENLRANGCDVPVIILTAESRPISKIQLLDAGADDYMTKPFSLGELKARLRALLRNAAYRQTRASALIFGDLTLDPASYVVKRVGQSIQLRPKEFALLESLMRHGGNVVTRDRLISDVWDGQELPWTNTVDVHIKYLRDKIDRPFDWKLIKTVHGIGYRLNMQPVKQAVEHV
jgi:DNA-binding response OmpR family regulator